MSKVNHIRIVPEWNVKLKTVAKYMNNALNQNRTRVECKVIFVCFCGRIDKIRIVPEWNVK